MAALKTKEKIITYIFKNSEKLTLAVNCLYANRSTRFLKSNLYVLSKRYYLTIVSKYDKSVEKISEFSALTFYLSGGILYVSVFLQKGESYGT